MLVLLLGIAVNIASQDLLEKKWKAMSKSRIKSSFKNIEMELLASKIKEEQLENLADDCRKNLQVLQEQIHDRTLSFYEDEYASLSVYALEEYQQLVLHQINLVNAQIAEQEAKIQSERSIRENLQERMRRRGEQLNAIDVIHQIPDERFPKDLKKLLLSFCCPGTKLELPGTLSSCDK